MFSGKMVDALFGLLTFKGRIRQFLLSWAACSDFPYVRLFKLQPVEQQTFPLP